LVTGALVLERILLLFLITSSSINVKIYLNALNRTLGCLKFFQPTQLEIINTTTYEWQFR